MFLIAYRREITEVVSFPQPTRWIDLPSGYEGSRQVALKVLSQGKMFEDAHRYIEPPKATSTLRPAVTAEDAIGDLPEIKARELAEKGLLKRGAQRLDKLLPYDDSRPISNYARTMKNWPGFLAGEGIFDHAIRYLPRDYLSSPG
jgi:DNA (cytosine-5)-methyltransferase 1